MNSVEAHKSMGNGVIQSGHVTRPVTRVKKGVCNLFQT